MIPSDPIVQLTSVSWISRSLDNFKKDLESHRIRGENHESGSMMPRTLGFNNIPLIFFTIIYNLLTKYNKNT